MTESLHLLQKEEKIWETPIYELWHQVSPLILWQTLHTRSQLLFVFTFALKQKTLPRNYSKAKHHLAHRFILS